MRGLGDYIRGTWNSIKAMWNGTFLMQIRVDRFFMHIFYTFLLFWLAILVGMMVDKTMVKVEKNKDTLNDLKIYHAQKTVQVERLNSISKIVTLLGEKGSVLEIPEQPATKIEK